MCLTKGTENLDQVQKDEDRERIILKIDSGAVDTCIPPEVGKKLKLEESIMSKAKVVYRAANGTPIKNHGRECFLLGMITGNHSRLKHKWWM